MLRDLSLSIRWASWKNLFHTSSESVHILTIKVFLPDGFPRLSQFSHIAIGQTFRFGFLQSRRFDQYSLPLISFPRTVPLQHDGGKDRVFTSPPGQSGVAGW